MMVMMTMSFARRLHILRKFLKCRLRAVKVAGLKSFPQRRKIFAELALLYAGLLSCCPLRCLHQTLNLRKGALRTLQISRLKRRRQTLEVASHCG